MIWRRDDAEAEHAEQPRVPAPPARKDKDMAENGEVTIVGTGARLEGNVVSAGNLRIDGQVKGQINADGDVVLSPQSQVEADIRSLVRRNTMRPLMNLPLYSPIAPAAARKPG